MIEALQVHTKDTDNKLSTLTQRPVEKSVKNKMGIKNEGLVLTSLPGEVSPRGLSSVRKTESVKLEQISLPSL